MHMYFHAFPSTAVLVVGFQVAIAVYGKFRNGRLDEYVRCFEDSIGYESGTLPSNITFPVRLLIS